MSGLRLRVGDDVDDDDDNVLAPVPELNHRTSRKRHTRDNGERHNKAIVCAHACICMCICTYVCVCECVCFYYGL